MTGQMDKEYLARVDIIVGEVPPLEDIDGVVSEFYKERPEASGWRGKDVPKELMARVDAASTPKITGHASIFLPADHIPKVLGLLEELIGQPPNMEHLKGEWQYVGLVPRSKLSHCCLKD